MLLLVQLKLKKFFLPAQLPFELNQLNNTLFEHFLYQFFSNYRPKTNIPQYFPDPNPNSIFDMLGNQVFFFLNFFIQLSLLRDPLFKFLFWLRRIAIPESALASCVKSRVFLWYFLSHFLPFLAAIVVYFHSSKLIQKYLLHFFSEIILRQRIA